MVGRESQLVDASNTGCSVPSGRNALKQPLVARTWHFPPTAMSWYNSAEFGTAAKGDMPTEMLQLEGEFDLLSNTTITQGTPCILFSARVVARALTSREVISPSVRRNHRFDILSAAKCGWDFSSTTGFVPPKDSNRRRF